MQFRYLIFGLILAAGFVGVQWLNTLPGIPPVRAPVAAVPAQQPASGDATAAAERFKLGEDQAPVAAAVVLPVLNDSDAWLQERLIADAVPWLAQSDLVRTLAVVLENAARGQLPRKFLGFLAPTGKFTVARSASTLQVDRASYARYNGFVSALQSLPPERAAELFRLIEPLLAEAVRELGEDTATPRQLAYTALGVALATPRVDSAVPLQQPKVVYTYADEALEDLLPLQKQLLRMGPDNLVVVRFWLEDFGAALSPANLLTDDVAAPGAVTVDDLLDVQASPNSDR